MFFLTLPIRNETTSHPIREIFRHICKARKPPCRERVAFFLLFPSIYSFAEGGLCSHYLYIYQLPSQWQPFLISSYQFFGGYSHIVPCFVSTSLPPPKKKQPVAVVVIYILRTFALKLSIVTLYVPCLPTIWASIMCARRPSVMTSMVPLNPPMLWLVASPFMRHRPIVLAFTMLGQPPTRIFFLPSAEKKTPLVACKIYIFLTFAY